MLFFFIKHLKTYFCFNNVRAYLNTGKLNFIPLRCKGAKAYTAKARTG